MSSRRRGFHASGRALRHSHAGMWLPPMQMLATRHHVEVLPLIKLGCAPFDVVQTKNGGHLHCGPFRTWALAPCAATGPR